MKPVQRQFIANLKSFNRKERFFLVVGPWARVDTRPAQAHNRGGRAV